MPDYLDISNRYREKFLANQAAFNARYQKIFDRIIEQFSQIIDDPNIRFAKAFVLNPYLDERITAMMTDFHDRVLEMQVSDIERAWNLSNAKNDQLVGQFLSTIGTIRAAQKAAYFLPNTPALKAFIANMADHGTGSLSDSVWKVAEQLRAEMTAHLGIAITNGDSAQVLSRRIRQYLQNPNALFRRVRNENGKLVASKAMLEYHPGQGVYRSAFKNAMRLARSNTNQAFLLADNIRWNQLDMVKGIKISLSAQHPEYNFPEICEVCEGTYPKDFVWTGWHTQCLCHATPVLSSSEDFLNYLKGGQKELNKMVREYPAGFRDYLSTNYETLSGYRTMPYWIQDNEQIIAGLLKK